jgi:methionyl-tRNA synthetase
MLEMVTANPALMQVIGDLLVMNFDWPMAKEVAERLKKMLPPQLQDQDANALPQAQAKLAQQSQMLQQMTAVVHQLSAKLEGQQVQAASRERIALIQAKAGIIEASMKTQSEEAMRAFEADLEQIDRQLALIPDPAMGQEAGGAAAKPGSSKASDVGSPQMPPPAQPQQSPQQISA